jgi:organic radical activating enzyme
MDLKLPSVSGETHWTEHTKFLQLCSNTKLEVFVKIIVSQSTVPEELEQAALLIAQINDQIPVFLQPVTPLTPAQQFSSVAMVAPTPEQVLAWQVLMKRFVKYVRVIPQTHKMLNQM